MKRVHIHNQNIGRINEYKLTGWRETKRFGDLVEMELSNFSQQKQRALSWFSKTMLTIKSGIKGVGQWKT